MKRGGDDDDDKDIACRICNRKPFGTDVQVHEHNIHRMRAGKALRYEIKKNK